MLRTELEAVEAHARAVASLAAERVPVGPFDAFLPPDGEADGDPGTPAYAMPARPTGDQAALRADLAALAALFAARGRPLRIELTLLLWPELPPALAAAGLAQAEDTPLFVATRASFRPRALPGLSLRWVAAGESPAFALALVRQGFELRGPPPTPEELAGLRRSLDGPLRLATAALDGRPAGAGFSTPLGPTTEISGLATLPAQRRRGVAGAVASFVVAEHLAAGGEVAWAASGDPRAAAVLLGVGFQDAGLRVGWSLP
jgi:hypothetical protein